MHAEVMLTAGHSKQKGTAAPGPLSGGYYRLARVSTGWAW